MDVWYHNEITYPFVPQEVLDSVDSVRASLRQMTLDRLGDRLNLEFEPTSLTDKERQTAHELAERRFGAASWTKRR